MSKIHPLDVAKLFLDYVSKLRDAHKSEIVLLKLIHTKHLNKGTTTSNSINKRLELVKRAHNTLTVSYKSLKERLADYLLKSGVSFTYPGVAEINEIEHRVSKIPLDERASGVFNKDPEIYQLIKRRADIIRNVYNKRYHISAFLYFMLNADENRRALFMNLLEYPLNTDASEFISSINIESLHGSLDYILFNLLLEIYSIPYEDLNTVLYNSKISEEDLNTILSDKYKINIIDFDGNILFVPYTDHTHVSELLDKYKAISNRIQLMNAERNIKTFSPEEEKVFESLQKEYVSILSSVRELSRKYSDPNTIQSLFQ